LQAGPPRAFSLVELLTVVAILGILSVMAIGAFGNIQRGYALTQAASQVLDSFAMARQEAIARNRIVEVRFCRKFAADPFTHLALVADDGNGNRKLLTRPFRIPDTLLVDEGATLSTLINGRTESDGGGSGDVPIPALASTYRFRSFQFRPDGTTDLPWDATSNQRYFVSLRPETDTNSPPANFALIQVNPRNGSTRLFRP